MSRGTRTRHKTKPPGAVALKRAREDADLTQEEAAKRLDTDVGSLSRYETGKRQPRGDMLASMAALYNVPVGQLLGQTVVSRETSASFLPRDAPLVDHVLVKIGELRSLARQTDSLAGQIQAAMSTHRGLTDDLQRRAQHMDAPPSPNREIDPKIYGANVKRHRLALHMTSSELAALVGWQFGVDVEQIESGGYKWNVDESERERFARALKTNADALCDIPRAAMPKTKRKRPAR